MKVPATLQELVTNLAAGGDDPALIQILRHGREEWRARALAERAGRLAAGLREEGLAARQRVILFAPNSPSWVCAALAVLKVGGIPVPVDSQTSGKDLTHIVDNSGARWAFTTAALAPRLHEHASGGEQLRLVLLDGDEAAQGHWTQLLREHGGDIAQTSPEAEAVLFYTSGTSGPPKGVPLTHQNILRSLESVLGVGLVGREDCLLLPLPLHHVFPFVVGLFGPLILGARLVLPYSLTGPHLVRAMREGEATVLLGIPRLYAALFAAIRRRIAERGRIAAALFTALLRLAVLLRGYGAPHLGKTLFAPLRRQLAPHLRMLISGGAALDTDLARRLDALGWQVATGYGLTETSPVLSINPPSAGHLDTAGRALAGVELRTLATDDGVGEEVQARGANVFSGYLDLPEKTAAAFTDDGWFRTGDLGHLDAEGWLRLGGRASARIVLAGGENVDPARVEERLETCPSIREAGVLEQNGRLAALLVPEPETAREQHGAALKELLGREINAAFRGAPSYQRIGTLRIDASPLPRTRLGKLRRHLLAGRYRAAAEGRETPPKAGLIAYEDLAPEDRQLVDDPNAARVWRWLGEHFEGKRVTPDSDLRLDLEVDSLEWVSLTIELQQRIGLALEEEAIARIETVRDLLQEAAAAGEGTLEETVELEERLHEPEALLDTRQRRWLLAPGAANRLLGGLIHRLSRWAMRALFRLEVSGIEHIPHKGPCILTANHLSALDPAVILAVLEPAQRRITFWGGWTGLLFHRPWTRLVSRSLQVLPVDPRTGPISSLAFGAAALQRDGILVWFPEGRRSQDGELLRFRAGVGSLARSRPLTILPARIHGTLEALPPGSWRLRLRPVRIAFGAPLEPGALEQRGRGDTPAERIADALREAVRSLGD